MTDQGRATTSRCSQCGRLNRVPPHQTGTARCGACRTPLSPSQSGPTATGDPGRQVIDGWDSLMRLVPKDMALDRAVGRSGLGNPAANPVDWLAAATQIPRDDLDQIRLLRIHLASNKLAPPEVLSRALDTLARARAALDRTRLPES